MKRREFLKVASAASAVSLAKGSLAASRKGVVIVMEPLIEVLQTPSVRWAAEQLRSAIDARGVLCRIVDSPAQTPGSAFCVFFANVSPKLPPENPHGIEMTVAPDGFHIVPTQSSYAPALSIFAGNERGFIYALLELAERVRYGREPIAAMHFSEPLKEATANEVRSVSRYFCSEVEDKPWLYDRDFWLGYLDLLAACRFNRFCLGFGLEYDFPRGVTNDYLHFPYPYVLKVPGYGVRVMQLAAADGTALPAPVVLSDHEQQMNLDALKFIAVQTAARGLHFQLGIWTHAYEWTDSPNAYHRIEGLTPDTHASYCRDALAMLLKECPEIQGLTMRMHGESGIPEGSNDFWQTLFEAVKGCGRTVEIDMHAKGVDEKMISIAVATGMPVKLGAKYAAEHQSLGYQQADIRALEIPKPGHTGEGPFSLSSGARSFTRYGYADFLKAGAPYKLLFRLWPGTQRHLLSADPEMAAAYGRTAHFCGAVGLDLMEPLTFKGREGSGQPGGRCAYADVALEPKYDWQKFELYYRVWGRRLYDPGANPEAWRRWMRTQFGTGTMAAETAVANAGRTLPLLTSAHLPSASNHSFWPEIYANMPIVRGSEPSPYSDTPEPRCFGTVSPLDPQLFATIDDHAADLLANAANPRYSPIEVAQWMEDCANAASTALDDARRRTIARRSAAFRRMEADVEIQIGLGRFFAAKLRAGVLYAIFEQSQDINAGREALDEYRMAREAWADMATRAATVYRADISYGIVPMRRGHWSDRLSAIDEDLEALTEQIKSVGRTDVSTEGTRIAIGAATGRPGRPLAACVHHPPASFEAGAPLALSVTVLVASEVTSMRLHYRHTDQAERWKQVEMQQDGESFTAAIPADCTQSDFPLEYYFDLEAKNGATRLEPLFNATLSNQPYYALMRRGRSLTRSGRSAAQRPPSRKTLTTMPFNRCTDSSAMRYPEL
jgi:hypothetical protein